MADFKVKTARELADLIEKNIADFEPQYIRNTPHAASFPLLYFRIIINPKLMIDAYITVSLHARDKSDNHVGGLETHFNVELPDEELDKFLLYYQYTQTDTNATKKDRVITYNIPLFRGTYRAFE